MCIKITKCYRYNSNFCRASQKIVSLSKILSDDSFLTANEKLENEKLKRQVGITESCLKTGIFICKINSVNLKISKRQLKFKASVLKRNCTKFLLPSVS